MKLIFKKKNTDMNYKMNRLQLVFFFLFAISNFSFSQNNTLFSELHEKYWFYRERLKYFVDPGEGIGKSIILDCRNRNGTSSFRVGDQTYDLGWYIGILSTEYYLLSDANQIQETRYQTLTELYYAIRAFERLDSCETFEPWNKSNPELDGFFMRYDIQLTTGESSFNTNNLNHGLTDQESVTRRPPGLPSYIDDYDAGDNNYEEWVKTAMSQDHAAVMIMGLGFVTKCLPSGEIGFINTVTGEYDSFDFVGRASTNINNIGNYIGNITLQNGTEWYINDDWEEWIIQLISWGTGLGGVNSETPMSGYWTIFDPNSDIVKRGHWAYVNRYGFKQAIKSLTNHTVPTDMPGNIGGAIGDGDEIWKHWADVPIGQYHSRLFASVIAAIGDSWNSTIPYRHTDDRIYNLLTQTDHDLFYILLYIMFQGPDDDANSEYINNGDNNTSNTEADIEEWLAEAPFCGPYSYGDPNAGDNMYFEFCDCELPKVAEDQWGSQNRFRHQFSEQMGYHWLKGNFPGLDYMLLYNLYHYYRNWWYGWDYGYIPYRNMINSVSDQEYPYAENGSYNGTTSNPANLRAFNSFEYNGTISEENGNNGELNLIAGESIKLTPGFHVYQGGHFSAKIEEFDCWARSQDTKSSMFADNNYIEYEWEELPDNSPFITSEEETQEFEKNSPIKESGSIIVIPNPAKNQIQFQFETANISSYSLIIRDVYGNTIITETNYQSGANLNISTLSNGIYIAEVVINGQVYQEKFVVM